MNVLKTAPQLRTSVLLGTFSGAKRWIDRKIDTNKTSKFTTTDGGWCRWLRYIIYQRASFLWGNNVFPLWFSRLSSESPESFIILLTDSGVKLRYPSPLSCWSLCSCCYFKMCLTETPLTSEAFNYRNWKTTARKMPNTCCFFPGGNSHIKVTGMLVGKLKLYP